MDIQHHLNSKIKTYLGLYIFIGLLFSHYSHASTTNIAIFDTGYCIKKIKSYSKNIHIHAPVNLTQDKNQDFCHLKLTHPRLHGHNVLITLLKDLKPIERIDIYPIIIFNNQSRQTMQAWNKAIDYSLKNKVDYLLLAVGLSIKTKITKKLPVPFFASAPTVGGSINKSSKVWPQDITNSNSILIGSYFSYKEDIYANTALLYQNKINFYFKNSQVKESFFKGSSYSVAHAMNKAITICHKSFKKGMTELKKCLNEKKSKLINNIFSY